MSKFILNQQNYCFNFHQKNLIGKKKKYFFAVLLISLSFLHSFSQTITKNSFLGANDIIAQSNATASNSPTLTPDDTWGYTATVSNGQIIKTSNTLQIVNWWDNNATIDFDQVTIDGFTNVQFSISYSTDGTPDSNEDLFLDYAYFDAGSWVYNTVTLIDAIDGNGDALAFGTAGTLPNPYIVSIPDSATLFDVTIRADEFINADSGTGGQDFYYIDDVILTGAASPDPSAADDNLEVIKNSGTGAANRIDVSTNDAIGSEGGDGDDYSINTSPTNGTVSKITDGVFEYIPNSGYVGADSFIYNICDTSNDCATATVNITVGFGTCTPTNNSNASSRNIYLTNVNIPGNTYTLNNTSGDSGGYSDFTASVPAVDFYLSTVYTATLTGGSNPAWQRDQVHLAIFLDLNQDGDFDDIGETLYISNGWETQSTTYDPIDIAIPAYATLGQTVMRIGTRFQRDPQTCDTDTSRAAEYEDYLVEIKEPSTPAALNDDLYVLMNSTPGAANQIDVSTNDVLGSDGGNPNNYTLTSPSTTANGGIITEVSDGVFQYIPSTDFIGTDSFTYSVCDVTPDCVSATVNITVNHGGCVPTSGSQKTRYITNVNLIGETTDINYTSGDDGGYANYTDVAAADLFLGGNYDLTVSIDGDSNLAGWAAYIDFNQNGFFDDAGEKIYETGGTESYSPFATLNFNVPTSALSGPTIIRIGTRNDYSSGESCGTTSSSAEEFEDYEVNISIDPSSAQDISVRGNNNEIQNGSTTPTFPNFTDFGVYDLNGGSKTRVYTIINNGGQPLVLGATPVTFQLGSSTDYTIISQPASLTVINSGDSETFSISFDPSSINSNITATVIVNSNDPIEGTYDFLITGEGKELYPDTDGDGISNNADIDDDNDGIADSVEQLTCLTYTTASVVETVFLHETFGFGNNRTTINSSTDGVTTTYCYEDGVTGQTPEECDSAYGLNDGEYTVHYSITDADGVNNEISATGPDISEWSDYAWYSGEDHTPADTNGRMAIFNAAQDPGVFYEFVVSGILPSVPVNYSFWAINIDNADSQFSSGELPRGNPNITVKFLSSDYTTEYASFDTGDITRCTSGNSCVQSIWKEFGTNVIIAQSEFIIQFINNAPGGNGNDLAIDDILITQSLCDLDHDGVPDVLDLDNDNDGIPNIIEFGGVINPDPDRDATVAGSTWVDINSNGMHDNYEGLTPLDSDSDGTPDYLDLDSDNDAIFDGVEYDGKGDLDESGDGASEGTDIQTGFANDAFDDDGLLGPIDGNDDDADSNDHGSASYALPLDSDGDGTPDYLDVDSNDAANNPADGSDIDTTEIYAHFDADNDGIIDGSGDTDNDGILDIFDTDNTIYGSPRDLDGSYTLFFDGRNDYVEDDTVLASGDATIMAWIKSEGDNTLNTNRIVAGQSNFYIMVNDSNNSVSLVLNGSTVLTSTDLVVDAIWTHVAATTSATETVLYINGEPQGSPITYGGISTDTSNFTIGRTPNNDSNYFHGEIDEVRVFNEALTELELKRMVYQELDNSFNRGAIIPLDIDAANTFSSSLLRYFKMDTIKDDILDDETTGTIDVGTGARMYNIHNIYFQTAPLPYETVATGDWSAKATWLHGDVWDIADEINNKPWSIVHIKHSIATSVNHGTLGLIVDAGIELEINDDVELNNSWYLNLKGIIDLEGESQLVQTKESVLIATGTIEKDQQGTENLYTYNYWSSPVHTSNPNADVDGDETYTVASVLKDGQDPDNPAAISFVGGYDGNNTSNPIELANYWIWKFDDSSFANYYAWQQVKSTGTLTVGEGYTMKGPGTGPVATNKNYVFDGTPNNGEILLPITGGNASLVGNPYPSAIDAHVFLDNNPNLDGTLYFWEHYGGGSHLLSEYEGGYGTYNYSGGLPAIAKATPDADVSQTGVSTKFPTRYIPVGQGFFVKATSTGSVIFDNDQRIFVTEANSSNSLFMKGTVGKTKKTTVDSSLEDIRTKLRLNYNSPNGYTRQLLTTVDENATMQSDRGYDAPLIEDNVEDMYWNIGKNNFVIQGINEPTEETVLPLTVKAKTTGEIEIVLSELKYPTEDFELYLKDNATDTYHDLLENNSFTTSIEAGITSNRFEIVFAKPSSTLSLSEDELSENEIRVYFDNTNDALQISNPKNASIQNIVGNNILGQSILLKTINSTNKNITVPANLALGIYIFTIETDHSKIIKKIIIK